MLSWEKPLVKPMPAGSTLHHISLRSTILVYYLFCNLYFPIYIPKIPKIFILLSLSDLTFASGREGIDNPFTVLVARFLIVCAGTRRFVCSLLLDWYLGSQKLREILTLLCCITLSSSRENQHRAQEVARRISGAVAGESTQKSTYQVPITNPYPSHYIFAICLSFSSPPLHLCLFFALLPFVLLFARVTMCLLLACIFAC